VRGQPRLDPRGLPGLILPAGRHAEASSHDGGDDTRGCNAETSLRTPGTTPLSDVEICPVVMLREENHDSLTIAKAHVK